MKDRSIVRALASSYTYSRTEEISPVFPTLSYRERFSVLLVTARAPRAVTGTAAFVVYKVTLALWWNLDINGGEEQHNSKVKLQW